MNTSDASTPNTNIFSKLPHFVKWLIVFLIVGIVVLAGGKQLGDNSETFLALLSTWGVLIFIYYQDIQRRSHQELAAHLGLELLYRPNFSDNPAFRLSGYYQGRMVEVQPVKSMAIFHFGNKPEYRISTVDRPQSSRGGPGTHTKTKKMLEVNVRLSKPFTNPLASEMREQILHITSQYNFKKLSVHQNDWFRDFESNTLIVDEKQLRIRSLLGYASSNLLRNRRLIREHLDALSEIADYLEELSD